MSASPVLALAVAIVWAPAPQEAEKRKPPKEPAEPFVLFVHTRSRGDPEVVAKIRSATKEIQEIFDRDRKWFRRTEDAEHAEIVLGVEALGAEEMMGHGATPESGLLFGQPGEHHVLTASLTLFGSVLAVSASSHRDAEKGAAYALAKMIQQRIKRNYREMIERRELSRELSPQDSGPQIGRAWIAGEITRRAEEIELRILSVEWVESTLVLTTQHDELRFPFPREDFEECLANFDCQHQIVNHVVEILEDR